MQLVSVFQLSLCMDINPGVKNTFRPPGYTRTAMLTGIQSFQLTCRQDLGENSHLLQISLNATCRKEEKKNLYLLAVKCLSCKLYMTTGPIDSLLFFSV